MEKFSPEKSTVPELEWFQKWFTTRAKPSGPYFSGAKLPSDLLSTSRPPGSIKLPKKCRRVELPVTVK